MEKKRKLVESAAQQESSPSSNDQPQLISDLPLVEEHIIGDNQIAVEEVGKSASAEDLAARNEENGEHEDEEEAYEEVYEDVIEEVEVDEEIEGTEHDEHIVDKEEHKPKKQTQEEPLKNLLENFDKDKLVSLITEFAEKYTEIGDYVRLEADKPIALRKIYVYGIRLDTTTTILSNSFKQYGEIVQCKVVRDRVSKQSKGRGFVVFKSRKEALEALKTPHKMIENRVVSCRFGAPSENITNQDRLHRKIQISNLSSAIDPIHLAKHFSQFGEIEEGPIELSNDGKLKSSCFFTYKTIDGVNKALKRTRRKFQGHVLHCKRLISPQKTMDSLRNPKSGAPLMHHIHPHYVPVYPDSGMRLGSSSHSLSSYDLEQPPTGLDSRTFVHSNRGLYDIGPSRSAIAQGSHGGYGIPPTLHGGYSNNQMLHEDSMYYSRY